MPKNPPASGADPPTALTFGGDLRRTEFYPPLLGYLFVNWNGGSLSSRG